MCRYDNKIVAGLNFHKIYLCSLFSMFQMFDYSSCQTPYDNLTNFWFVHEQFTIHLGSILDLLLHSITFISTSVAKLLKFRLSTCYCFYFSQYFFLAYVKKVIVFIFLSFFLNLRTYVLEISTSYIYMAVYLWNIQIPPFRHLLGKSRQSFGQWSKLQRVTIFIPSFQKLLSKIHPEQG